MEVIGLFLGALALDLTLGEPPPLLHPVVWMGKTVSLLERPGLKLPPALQMVYGALMVIFIAALFAAPAYYLLIYLRAVSPLLFWVAGISIFKTTFALKELRQAALKIKRWLIQKDLDRARFDLRSLVKRDTAGLPEPLLVSAVVESVSENLCDSVIAPVFYLLLFGVPGAVAYRVVNTMDAMIGYHGKYERLGKFTARLDSILNMVPARLTALMIVLAALILRKNWRGSWHTAWKEHRRTSSWNAGWPMAAGAGALDVRLEKVGNYTLYGGDKPLTPSSIDGSLGLAQAAMLPCLVMVILGGVIRYAVTA